MVFAMSFVFDIVVPFSIRIDIAFDCRIPEAFFTLFQSWRLEILNVMLETNFLHDSRRLRRSIFLNSDLVFLKLTKLGVDGYRRNVFQAFFNLFLAC